jgi:hypothetical protein
MTTDDLVSVMVPRKHLSQVYGLIAKLDGGDASGSAAVPVPTAPTNGNGAESDEWTPSRLRKMLQQSPPAMKDLLRVMAQHPDQWLTTQQLAKAIQGNANADWKTVAGTMGAFGRRVKNRYALESFPFEKRYDHEAKSKVYRMTGAMSAQVLQVLQEV